MAMLAGVATVSTVTVGAGTAAAAGNLRCDVLYSVDNNAGKAKQIDPATGAATDAFDVLPSGDTRHNQLGIGPGGAYAIYTSGDGNIYKYDAASGKTTSTARDKGVTVDTHGAINPANGLFYYGGKDNNADSFTFGAYDPVNNKSLGVVLKVNFDKKTTVRAATATSRSMPRATCSSSRPGQRPHLLGRGPDADVFSADSDGQGDHRGIELVQEEQFDCVRTEWLPVRRWRRKPPQGRSGYGQGSPEQPEELVHDRHGLLQRSEHDRAAQESAQWARRKR
ncbi:hypothetical protein P9209_15560 [Prescottella defluvii]|nr:hypothetical protein P9209_15560 [Prescottella defluvii]